MTRLQPPIIPLREAQQILKSHQRTRHIPVIAVSANVMPPTVSASLAAGFFDYIGKPIQIAALNQAIDRAYQLSILQRPKNDPGREPRR